MEEFPQLMLYIFAESQIAKQVQLQEAKLGSVSIHSLAPYCKEKALASIKDASHFVACFDESFNSKSNKKQLDLHIAWNHSPFFKVGKSKF